MCVCACAGLLVTLVVILKIGRHSTQQSEAPLNAFCGFNSIAVCLQEGMEFLGLLKFLRENPTSENRRMVFPSPADIRIIPSDLDAIITWRHINKQTRNFFQLFLDDLCNGKIGMHRSVCTFTHSQQITRKLSFHSGVWKFRS